MTKIGDIFFHKKKEKSEHEDVALTGEYTCLIRLKGKERIHEEKKRKRTT
jgi:hypothetical protein